MDTELRQTLHRRGLRMTPQRQLVLDAVSELGHATPEAVCTRVQATAPAVNITTVYRTLDLLEQLGVVKHTHLGHGAPTYATSEHEHVHLVCHRCGRVDEIHAGALDDHVAAIRELGRRHPWLDTDRVGITGHSAGGFAAARGILAHPDLYRVAVAVAGNHDDTYGLQMWAEHYHGDADRSALSTPALAANLRGKLLLVHGELDETVLVSQTHRLVDALITADKDVDVLIVPGGDHAILHRRHYVFRRTWDHFVRHLHGQEPPAYRVAPLPLG